MRLSFAFRLMLSVPLVASCSSQPSEQGSGGEAVNDSAGGTGQVASGSALGGTQAAPAGGASGTALPNPTTGGVGGAGPAIGSDSAGTGGGPSSDGAAGGSPNSNGATGGMTGTDSGSGGLGGSTVADPGTEGDGDFNITAPYQAAPELTVADGVPRGLFEMFTLSSSLSAIYPVDVATGNVFTRNIWVYVPAQYVTGTRAPFMVVQDGGGYTNRIPPILDNLINDRRLPVMIAILINPGPGDGITSERGLEYDTVSDAYLRFVETEILPSVEALYNVVLTTDPEGRASVGQSSGGTAAFTMGWFGPDLYRRVLTYSGSFVALGADATYPRGAWEYHEHVINESDAKPLRVLLEAGQNDNTVANVTHDLNPALSAYYGWLEANQNMAAVLKAKGYHYRYIYADGAGHADGNVIAETLPESLLWLWRGYPIP